METQFICVAIFLAAYLLNIFYITVFYHRGLTHGAVKLKPWTLKFLILTGNWITGLDPKGWACMHRLHHRHSDTELDPHSPVHQGLLKLFMGQLHSYKRCLVGIQRKEEPYYSIVRDLDFPVSWLNRSKMWALPYLLHALLAVMLGVLFSSAWVSLAYWLGIMSHPIQGWMVNALAHKYGTVNFATSDNSKNNTLVALLVMGEGYQNNHHHMPHSPKFSWKASEYDMGYSLCLIARQLGAIEF